MSPIAVAQIQHLLDSFASGGPCRSVSFEGLTPATKVLSTSGDVPRPAASVIKLPLFMAALRAHGAENPVFYRRDLSETRYATILSALEPDHRFSLKELVKLGIITSDNPIAVALGERTGFDTVNSLLRDIGCSPKASMAAGFSEAELGPRNRENLLTTDDCLLILKAIDADFPDIKDAMSNNLRNTRINLFMPESWDVPHKTGSLEGVVNDIAIIDNGEKRFAITYLTDNEADPDKTATEIGRNALAVAETFFAE